MKKFIYTDMDAVKSVSAQIYQGNILEQEFGQEESAGNTLENASSNSNETSSGGGLGLNIPLLASEINSGSKSTDEESKVTIEEVIRKDNEVRKIVLDEFLINKVEDTLLDKNLLLEINKAKQFDYVISESEFELYDFDLLKKVVNYEKMLPFLNFNEKFNHIEDFVDINNEYKKLYKNHIKDKTMDSIRIKTSKGKLKDKENIKKFIELNKASTFKLVEFVSDHINSIIQNKVMLVSKNRDIIIFCDKNKLKYSSLILSLSGTLTLKIFGQLTTIKILEGGNALQDDETFNVDQIMNKPTTLLFETYLAEFLNMKKGMKYKIIHPLSIESI